MPIGIRVARSARRRAAAALAAVAVAVVGLTIILDLDATAASPVSSTRTVAAVSAPVTTTVGGVSLAVDPAGGLTAAGATLKVTGNGFQTANGLYVAVCHADGKAPASLQDCVGGAIPTSNASNSWAHITPGTPGSPGPPGTGPVMSTWGSNGSFVVSINLPASDSASDALDCSKVACALYTKPDTGNDQSQDLSVPLVYAAPSTSVSATPSSSAALSTTSQVVVTSTIAPAPTTVKPKSIRSASIAAGGSQEVLFAGFAKGEVVGVRLDSTALPALRADADGVVKVDFVVPLTTPVGTHLLSVAGQTSRITGVASFQVTAAPVTKAPASSAAPASPVSSSATSSAPVSSAVIAPLPVSSASAPSSQPVASSSAIAPLVGPVSSTSGRTVWPWYVLGLVVLLCIVFAIYMMQRRRSKLAAEMLDKDRILAEGAAAEDGRAAEATSRANADAPTAYIGPMSTNEPGDYTGYHPGEHGLLSGRDNPDNPGLLSGQQYRPDGAGDPPTTYLRPDAPRSPDAGGSPAGGSPTGVWTPDFSRDAQADGGPGTTAWRPDFGDGASGDDRAAGDGGGEDSAGDDPAGRHSR